MKPKLIILNGPLGIGKSTLAERYAEERPLTLNLDIDNVRAMISHWRENKEVSAPLSKKMAIEMARVSLNNGNDVVIPQIIQYAELVNMFQSLAAECNAAYFEVLFFVDKEEAIRRFIERGKQAGHPTGFREGGIIATSGREEKLSEMYDNMMEVSEHSLSVIRIEPVFGDIDGTYSTLMEKLSG